MAGGTFQAGRISVKLLVAIHADLWYMFVLQGGEPMKKLIMATVITVCLVLCAVMWPQSKAAGEEASRPKRVPAMNVAKEPAMRFKGPIEVPMFQAEKETPELPQPELPMETVPEPEPVPTETPLVPEVQSTPEPNPTSEPEPEPTPAQTSSVPQAGDMVYVPGFGWLESQGEGTVTYDDMMFENGNKVGSMG